MRIWNIFLETFVCAGNLKPLHLSWEPEMANIDELFTLQADYILLHVDKQGAGQGQIRNAE